MGWFPATGAVPVKDDPRRALHQAFLPALGLAAGGVAEVSRQLRSSLVEILSSPQVRTLRAKGLRPFDVELLTTHGGSLRLFCCRADASHPQPQALKALRAREAAAGLGLLETYVGFTARVDAVRTAFLLSLTHM